MIIIKALLLAVTANLASGRFGARLHGRFVPVIMEP